MPFPFSFSISESLTLNLELTPKIGGWNLDTIAPYSINDAGAVVDTVEVKLDGSKAAGIEIGMEITDDQFSVRVWTDNAKSISDQDRNATSIQFGIDGFMQFWRCLYYF